MDNLEVIARFKIRPGQLDGFKAQVAEILRLTREKDTHTLRCDSFINHDGTDCEVHEMFPNEQGLIEHKMNTTEATETLFRDYASDHRSTIYGEVSHDFIKMGEARMLERPAKLLKSKIKVFDGEGTERGAILQDNVVGPKQFALVGATGDRIGSIDGENWISFSPSTTGPATRSGGSRRIGRAS